MTSDSVLAIIFIAMLAAMAVARYGLKKPTLVDLAGGVGALVLALVAHVTHNNVAPPWMIAGIGIAFFVQYWNKRHQQPPKVDNTK